jgi:predicted nucleic acid-binding protein
MNVYLDSSVVIRRLLKEDPALDSIAESEQLGSSDLLEIECKRVLQRERMAGHLDDRRYSESVVQLEEILDQLHLIAIGPAVKQRAAGAFPTVIGTLDAIHLASAILWEAAAPRSEFCLLTYDKQLALCARSLGMRLLSRVL